MQLDEPEPEILQLTPQGDTGAANTSDTTNFQHSPEPTLTALGDEGPKDSATPSHVSSSRVLDDIEV
jgi:hypothetical protein